ncbi:MAG: hypothetical protein QM784_01580 [Polyangiaceae bacterium]
MAGLSFAGCTPGGVGDPCIPEDEYGADFPGYGVEEVNVEAMSFQCETRLCLVNHFQGRVTCPYGQVVTNEDGSQLPAESVQNPCYLPDGNGHPVATDVSPQLLDRRAKDAVYCSCRCDGPDKNARYCECPSGYRCTLLNEIPLGASQLLGSYCVRNGTAYQKNDVSSTTCSGENCPYEGASAPNKNPFGPSN